MAAILAGCSLSAHAAAGGPQPVDIPAGDLREALLIASQQFGTDLVYRPEQIRESSTGGAHGQFTTEQAIFSLLEGTALQLRADPSGAMLITQSGPGAHTLRRSRRNPPRRRAIRAGAGTQAPPRQLQRRSWKRRRGRSGRHGLQPKSDR